MNVTYVKGLRERGRLRAFTLPRCCAPRGVRQIVAHLKATNYYPWLREQATGRI